MEIKNILLSEKYPDATLTAYLPFTRKTASDAILICPGGGYYTVCDGHEGEAIAMAFSARGFRCFVLKYSVGEKAKFPTPLIEASLAMSHIKRNATEYGVDPERVFVLGFSAGGHLAGSLGTLWHKEWLNAQLDLPFGENKPKGMVLCYPVLSYFEETHKGTFRYALGEEPNEENTREISLDLQVDGEHTVPAFLWHTMDDGCVHVENTLRMLSALRRHNVTAEAHLYPHGPHGMATADLTIAGNQNQYLNDRVAGWVDLAVSFMTTLA